MIEHVSYRVRGECIGCACAHRSAPSASVLRLLGSAARASAGLPSAAPRAAARGPSISTAASRPSAPQCFERAFACSPFCCMCFQCLILLDVDWALVRLCVLGCFAPVPSRPGPRPRASWRSSACRRAGRSSTRPSWSRSLYSKSFSTDSCYLCFMCYVVSFVKPNTPDNVLLVYRSVFCLNEQTHVLAVFDQPISYWDLPGSGLLGPPWFWRRPPLYYYYYYYY